MKRQKHSSSGYSFVEILIVMAIMLILTALSLLTWRSVDSARYTKAAATLQSEMSTLRTTTMAQDSRMAMRLYLGADGVYYIERGYYEGGSFQIPDDSSVLGQSSYYDYIGVSNPVKILERGTLYCEEVGSLATPIDENGVIIRFGKSDGSMVSGAGQYRLYRRNGELIANIHLPSDTGLFYVTYTED